MIKVAVALLRLPDGRIVFQRRDKKARFGTNLLGFFGGHVEEGETFEAAVKRELKEETSLGLALDEYNLIGTLIHTFDVAEGEVSLAIFEAQINDADFEVYEGQGAEVYSKEEAVTRSDLTVSARYALEKLV